ncbi:MULTISPECIES: TonB-dependent receptor [Chitinophagaceae]
MRQCFLFIVLLFPLLAFSQFQIIVGTLKDAATKGVVAGATITEYPKGNTDISDINGKFQFRNTDQQRIEKITVSAVGFRTRTLDIALFKSNPVIYLQSSIATLADVKITSSTTNPYKSISEADIKLRGITNTQEVLRIIPGLFIGQHQGGGKAEQIFLRGFDNDHGTDINMSADGMPINMVSHAHGQGFADTHFIIPETIESTTYKKGMYEASKGDLAVTGFVDFHTADRIDNTVKLEAGQYNTYRALIMANLLKKDSSHNNDHSWYIASEYRYSNGYFENPQHFNRFNIFSKYSGHLNANNFLNVSVSTLYSKWNASGQVPQYAVDEGIIGFYGAIDPLEGGVTSRTNVNTQLTTTLKNNDIIRNQLYYSHYTFDLHSNFTFFLEDPVNGDEIRQQEHRNMFGYNGSYQHESFLGNTRWTTEAGVNVRTDLTYNSALSHTVNRFTLTNPIKLGNISEVSVGAYLSETFHFNKYFTFNAGVRFDQFYYRYNNKLASDTTLPGAGIYTAKNNIVSPKLNFYYQARQNLQFYLFTGKGFHSNDTRVVVAEKGLETLPAAYGTDLGTVFKPINNLVLNAAFWYSYLQKEYVYGGDGGTVDFSGRTRRIGFDFSARYQPIPSLYLDEDVNYAHGRATDEPSGENYIPLAPVWSNTGGVTYVLKNGLNGSLRYRWLGKRPANEDYSLTAIGYFVNDLVLNYTQKKYEVGLTINNLFNVRWKETQFEEVTRLKGGQAIDGITFTPGTKFCALVHFSYFF